MPSHSKLPESKPQGRPRVRRGNSADQEDLINEAVDIAGRQFEAGGIEAVSIRAVTREMGLSPTALYKYFEDKSDLLLALWARIIERVESRLRLADQQCSNASDALKATSEAMVSYYETHPEHFKLLFMTAQAIAPGAPGAWRAQGAYQQLTALSRDIMVRLAVELQGNVDRVPLALDLRLSMLVGYLHSRLVNTRYEWADLSQLRSEVLAQVDIAVRDCLLSKIAAHPSTTAPEGAFSRGSSGEVST